MIELLLGIALLAVALLLSARPGITRWISDKANRYRFNIEEGGEAARQRYNFNVRVLQVFIPFVLGIAGIALLFRGLS